PPEPSESPGPGVLPKLHRTLRTRSGFRTPRHFPERPRAFDGPTLLTARPRGQDSYRLGATPRIQPLQRNPRPESRGNHGLLRAKGPGIARACGPRTTHYLSNPRYHRPLLYLLNDVFRRLLASAFAARRYLKI